MNFLNVLIAMVMGGGNAVNADSVFSALMDMSNVQRNSVMQKLGAATSASVQQLGQTVQAIDEDLKTVYVGTIDVDGATPTIEPVAQKKYVCGELTSLTISNPPATGDYVIIFTSGATATVCNWSTIRWPGDVAPTIEANTEYEINVSDNKGVYNEGWPVPAAE